MEKFARKLKGSEINCSAHGSHNNAKGTLLINLLRYRAIGSALLVLKSLRNPEKLKTGSVASGRRELDACDDSAVDLGLAYGSNSSTLILRMTDLARGCGGGASGTSS